MLRIWVVWMFLLATLVPAQETACLEALARGERARLAGDKEKAAAFWRTARRAAERMPPGDTRPRLERRIQSLLRKTDPRDAGRTRVVNRAALELLRVANRYINAKWYATAEELLSIVATLNPHLAEKPMREVRARRLALRLARKETVREAIDAALDWLARHQTPGRGYWDADGFPRQCKGEPCQGAGFPLYDPGLTGLALLAFLDGGSTPHRGKHKKVVNDAVAYLERIQDPGGCFGARTGHFMYSHCVAALAMAKVYRTTRSPLLRKAVEKGTAFILEAQNRDAAGQGLLGWRYRVRSNRNDTSVTGWALRALLQAKRAGLAVPEEALDGGRKWIERMTDPETGRVGYTQTGVSPVRADEKSHAKWPRERSEAITAVGILASLLLGRDPGDPLLAKGVGLCVETPPDWNEREGSVDMYYWYFGTRALFLIGGTRWKSWDRALRFATIPHQRQAGCARGSWDPVGPWGELGGRVYSTALVCLCLEVVDQA